ncbi:iron-molybdenum cofactor biosynthesis protein NifQ [Pseudomonas syringae]|uniref:Iron-molybdenum cofactor biosynthesis protein NifQ n=2 Tax=Pseudomonas syringae TaxID=317 RepID=A0A1C7YZE4_PSESX|nr:iron-molybdenum cofactor biosynthesis protein NifQ [Pseudomonas syringae]
MEPLQAAPLPSQRRANRMWLARIIQAQRSGQSCLPFHLGLAEDEYAQLIGEHFPEQAGATSKGLGLLAHECAELREELLMMRNDEWQDLRGLLLAGRRGRGVDEVWMASIVAAGCMGGSHLWRDLGLASRLDLRELLVHNFPLLAMRNVLDMRWKKFFYKQLCEQEGGYVCRSPSCNICPTFQDCFGEEL